MNLHRQHAVRSSLTGISKTAKTILKKGTPSTKNTDFAIKVAVTHSFLQGVAVGAEQPELWEKPYVVFRPHAKHTARVKRASVLLAKLRKSRKP